MGGKLAEKGRREATFLGLAFFEASKTCGMYRNPTSIMPKQATSCQTTPGLLSTNLRCNRRLLL